MYLLDSLTIEWRLYFTLNLPQIHWKFLRVVLAYLQLFCDSVVSAVRQSEIKKRHQGYSGLMRYVNNTNATFSRQWTSSPVSLPTIYLNYLPEICLVFFSFFCLAVRNFRGRSIRDIVACEEHVPVVLGRSTLPARHGRVDATATEKHE